MSLPHTAVFQMTACTKAVAVPDVDETYGWWQYFPCALRRSHPGDCEPMAKDMPRIRELHRKYRATVPRPALLCVCGDTADAHAMRTISQSCSHCSCRRFRPGPELQRWLDLFPDAQAASDPLDSLLGFTQPS